MNSESSNTSYASIPVFVISAGRAAEEFRCSFGESNCFHNQSTRFETNLQSFRAHCKRVNATTHAAEKRAALDSWFAAFLTGHSQYTLISIEYDSIGQLEKGRTNPGEVPHFVDWLIESRFPVIHLVGNNPLDCFVERLLSASDEVDPGKPAIALADTAVQQIRKMKSDAARYRKWLAGGRLLEVNYESLFDSNGAISDLVVYKFSSFLGVDVDAVKTRPIARQQDQVQVETAKRVKRELRPVLTRAGYEKLYDLPKAA